MGAPLIDGNTSNSVRRIGGAVGCGGHDGGLVRVGSRASVSSLGEMSEYGEAPIEDEEGKHVGGEDGRERSLSRTRFAAWKPQSKWGGWIGF